MRVFVAGAGGAIGTRLVPQLIDAGHEVIGTSTSSTGAARVRALGAKPVGLDLLDAGAVRRAIVGASPITDWGWTTPPVAHSFERPTFTPA